MVTPAAALDSLNRLIEELEREDQRLAVGKRPEPGRFVGLLLAAVQDLSHLPDVVTTLHSRWLGLEKRFATGSAFDAACKRLHGELTNVQIGCRPKGMTEEEANGKLKLWRDAVSGNHTDLIRDDPAPVARELQVDFETWQLPDSARTAHREMLRELKRAAAENAVTPLRGMLLFVGCLKTPDNLMLLDVERLCDGNDENAPTVRDLLATAKWVGSLTPDWRTPSSHLDKREAPPVVPQTGPSFEPITRWRELRDQFRQIPADAAPGMIGNREWSIRRTKSPNGTTSWDPRDGLNNWNREQLRHVSRLAGDLLTSCPPLDADESVLAEADAAQRWWLYVGTVHRKFVMPDGAYLLLQCTDTEGNPHPIEETDIPNILAESKRVCDLIVAEFERQAAAVSERVERTVFFHENPLAYVQHLSAQHTSTLSELGSALKSVPDNPPPPVEPQAETLVDGNNAEREKGEAGGKPAKRKRGRKPAKAFVLVEQAVRNYHKFEGGIVDQQIRPITGRELARQSNGAFSASAADRWFRDRFGSKEAYELACLNGSLGKRLAINGDDVRAFGTFDATKNEVADDDDRTEEQDDSPKRREQQRPKIVRKF